MALLFSLSLSFHSLLCFQLVCSGPFFSARFPFFPLCPFCCFHFTPPSWMHPCSSLRSPPFLHFFSLAPHGMLSLGVQEGDVLKTLTDSQTQSSAAQSMQASSVQPSRASVDVWTCQDKGRRCSSGIFGLEVYNNTACLFIFVNGGCSSHGYT